MSLTWHAVQSKPRCETAAQVAIARQGFEACLPLMQVMRRHNHQIERVTVPRFSGYLFVRFDRRAPWGSICHGEAKRAGVVRVMCDGEGYPRPMPDRAIEAVRAYEPPEWGPPPKAHAYGAGEAVLVHIGPEPQQAVFVEYERGKGLVLVWILGAERIVPVALGRIEPAARALT